MSGLSGAITSLLGTKNTAPTGKVELPVAEDEPLVGKELAAATCELRIEGMTCSACVEVCS